MAAKLAWLTLTDGKSMSPKTVGPSSLRARSMAAETSAADAFGKTKEGRDVTLTVDGDKVTKIELPRGKGK